jgi:hypothetical protein
LKFFLFLYYKQWKNWWKGCVGGSHLSSSVKTNPIQNIYKKKIKIHGPFINNIWWNFFSPFFNRSDSTLYPKRGLYIRRSRELITHKSQVLALALALSSKSCFCSSCFISPRTIFTREKKWEQPVFFSVSLRFLLLLQPIRGRRSSTNRARN